MIAQQIPQLQQPSITWTQANHNQLVQNSPQTLLIRQQHTATADSQPFFIQNSNPTLQPGTPIYVNHPNGIMQLMSNNSVAQPQILTTTTTNSTPNSKATSNSTSSSQSKQQSNSSTSKLKTIRPASSLQNLNSLGSQSGLNKTQKQYSSSKLQNALEEGPKKLSKKQQLEQSEKNKFLTKSTQQMNLELLNSKLQRSDSLKSIDSVKSKNEGKLKKQQSGSLDEDSSSLSSSSKLNGVSKKDKSEKKVKQKAIVKPILSHCVDGYIIHESSYPFPVNITEELNDELEQIKLNNGMDKKQNQSDANVSHKEGKVKIKKLKKNKLKANSSTGLMNKNVLSNQQSESNAVEIQNRKNLESSKQEEPNSFVNNSINNNDNLNSRENSLNETNVYSWSVNQVYDYLISAEINEVMANKLKEAEVNGKTLLLLSFQMLSNYDKSIFKLGPCLKLQEKIDELKSKITVQDPITNYIPADKLNEDVKEWKLDDIYQFILNLTGKESYAAKFKVEEVDGESLGLISLDLIIKGLGIPFGPAQLIFSKVEELKKISKPDT